MSTSTKKAFVAGLRQVLREMKSGNVSQILLADDAEKSYRKTIVDAANLHGVPVTSGFSSEALAERCQVEVNTGVVGILK